VLGDWIPEYQMIFPNNEGLLRISMSDTDEDIIDLIHKFLEDPKQNAEAQRIAATRGYEEYANTIIDKLQKIVNRGVIR